MRGTDKRGFGSNNIWGPAPICNFQLPKPPKIFSETLPSCAYILIISSQGVHNTSIDNMDKIEVLHIICSLDVWDNVYILFRALNWLSVKPPTGRAAVKSFIYPPPSL